MPKKDTQSGVELGTGQCLDLDFPLSLVLLVNENPHYKTLELIAGGPSPTHLP